jgi:hypothetical protein
MQTVEHAGYFTSLSLLICKMGRIINTFLL